jgi:hypothetical protein
MTRGWLALLVVGCACRGLHEERVSERLLGRQLMEHEFSMTLQQLDALLSTVKYPEPGQDCELCLLSSQVTSDGNQLYCVISGMNTGCVVAKEARPGRLQMVAIARPLAAPLARALWRFVEGPTADSASEAAEASVSSITALEERDFEGAWSFFANAGTSAVLTLKTPAIGFGAQGGVRRWLNYYLMGGTGLEVEILPFTTRPLTVVGVQARAELTMWDEYFRRTLNLPNVSFLMAITPLAAFGTRPAFGARGVIGMQMLRLGNAWTPIRLELGYQYLVVNGFSVSGARAGLMLGF